MIALPQEFLERPIAHRALHNAERPENSMAAVRAAIEAGYGIEIDVQPSQSIKPMVFHDETLDRVTRGAGLIAETPDDVLRAVAFKTGDERGVPSLRSVLEVVDGRVPLLIEIKDQDGALGPDVGPLEDAVAKDLAGYEGPVAVMSFNPYSVAHLAKVLPNVARGLTTDPFSQADWPSVSDARRRFHRAMEMFETVGASFISHNQADLAATPVADIKAKGLPVLCWTIRSQEAESRAREVADNVTFEGYLP